MKKRVLCAVMALALGVGLLATGCGGSKEKKGTLTVFNYGEYMDPVV